MIGIPQVSIFIATSLDGMIARQDGSLDWLERANATTPPGEDFGYQQFIDSIDTIIMGKNTFEKVLTFPAWPYDGKEVIVLSSTLKKLPTAFKHHVSIISASPDVLINSLRASGTKSIYVDGGQTIQRFLQQNLIDYLTITTIPILLGDGIPLFKELPNDILLKHLRTQSYANGFVQSQYVRLK